MFHNQTNKTFYPKTKQRLMSLAVASACAAFVGQAYAQEAVSPAAPAEAVQTIVVTGLRAGMESTRNLKRDADGIVDGVVAEDIGKFPDSNLAESLQRISGVSIDRSNGEGQFVTVRGLGPDFNLVLLNGRQMPTTNLNDLGSRSFDFSNLSSDAISQLQVYKTGRADNPSGGIGATINIMTARPLDNLGMHSSFGVKGIDDTSAKNLPAPIKGSSLTPELSGIYTNTSDDGRFGVAISGSYQKRDSGFNQALVGSGYQGPFLGSDTTAGSTLPQPGTPGAKNITNRPGQNALYSIPQNFGYSVNSVQNVRINDQLVFQFRPIRDLTTTLDYTYSEHKVHTVRDEMSVWFGQTPTSTSSWPSGNVVSPLTYTESYNTPQDIVGNFGDYATKTKNQSVGFNADWKFSPIAKFSFDAHHSTSVSGADSPFGTNNQLQNASFSRGTTTIDYTNTLPVLTMPLANLVAQPMQATGSVFQNSWERAVIDQVQAAGSLRISEASKLNFGLAVTDAKNHSTFSNVQNNTWSGATKPSDYPGTLFQTYNLPSYFTHIPGNTAPGLYSQLYGTNFAALRAVTAAATGLPAMYLPNTTSADTDRTLKENSTSAYGSYNTDWDTAIPMHSSLGLRFEKTDVTSVAQVQPGTAMTWVSQNELPITFAGNSFSTTKASYNNVLPDINLDWEVRSDMKLRLSAGETIGRPRFDQLQGGLTVGTIANTYNGTASTGNPALKPVKSKNLDLSYEWYYDKESLVSMGFFRKVLDNYAGQTVVTQPLYNLHTPIGGAYYNSAVAQGCTVADTNCIRNYILSHYNGQPGVTQTGVLANGNLAGNIAGLSSDPLATFLTTTYANQKQANLNGLEFNVQHMFGRSGFGVLANYTYVHSPLKYNNDSKNDQFAILGLSNSANLVGIYEDKEWSIRLAYNWRGEFLASTVDPGGHASPVYTEAYGQVDTSVTYSLNKNISFQLEVINLANAIQRQVGRDELATLNVTQTGPRYMVGARYKF